jgi:hypothetical protein
MEQEEEREDAKDGGGAARQAEEQDLGPNEGLTPPQPRRDVSAAVLGPRRVCTLHQRWLQGGGSITSSSGHPLAGPSPSLDFRLLGTPVPFRNEWQRGRKGPGRQVRSPAAAVCPRRAVLS